MFLFCLENGTVHTECRRRLGVYIVPLLLRGIPYSARRPSARLLAVLEIEVLPRPPHSIHHCRIREGCKRLMGREALYSGSTSRPLPQMLYWTVLVDLPCCESLQGEARKTALRPHAQESVSLYF